MDCLKLLTVFSLAVSAWTVTTSPAILHIIIGTSAHDLNVKEGIVYKNYFAKTVLKYKKINPVRHPWITTRHKLKKIKQLNKFMKNLVLCFIFFWPFGSNTGQIVQVQNVLLASLKFISKKKTHD